MKNYSKPLVRKVEISANILIIQAMKMSTLPIQILLKKQQLQ